MTMQVRGDLLQLSIFYENFDYIPIFGFLQLGIVISHFIEKLKLSDVISPLQVHPVVKEEGSYSGFLTLTANSLCCFLLTKFGYC